MEINTKKKMFYTFLIINFLAWTLIQLTRNVISIDSMEAISWGEVIDFGTNKHPPFSGWLMGGFYHLFGQHDFIAYVLGEACLLIGFIFLYKLAKFFMSEEKAMCASMILSSCYYYTYILFIDNFNCNFVSMGLIPMIAYYFYKSVKQDKTKDWIIFGIASALGTLAKYQVIFLFLALLLYILLCRRDIFKRNGVYISILSGLIVILPHIVWLFKYDFFSFAYMADRTGVTLHNVPSFLIKYGRIIFPIKFIIDQLLSVLPCVLLLCLAALHAKNISVLKLSENKSETAFIWIVCIAPIVFQSLMGAFSNTRIMGMWGSMMVSFFGLLLFYQFPVKFNKNTFMFLYKWVCSLMVLWLISMFVFSQLQTKLHMGFPYQKVIPELNTAWDMASNNAELKYIGGNGEYVYKIKQYNKRPTKVLLETFGYKNPWITDEEILKSGAIIFGKTKKEVIQQTKDAIVLLPEDYKLNIKKCEFEIINKMGKSKNFEFYYAVIPPIEKN